MLSDNPQLRKGFRYALIIAIKAKTLTELITPLKYVFDDKELAPLSELTTVTIKRKVNRSELSLNPPRAKRFTTLYWRHCPVTLSLLNLLSYLSLPGH